MADLDMAKHPKNKGLTGDRQSFLVLRLIFIQGPSGITTP